MTSKTERYIGASKETMEKLMKAFGCSGATVRAALIYRANNLLARKIRHVAVTQYDARAMCHCPECETMHLTTSEGRQIMRQIFDNGIELTVDRATGDIIVRNSKGKLIRAEAHADIPKLTELQLFAESL